MKNLALYLVYTQNSKNTSNAPNSIFMQISHVNSPSGRAYANPVGDADVLPAFYPISATELALLKKFLFILMECLPCKIRQFSLEEHSQGIVFHWENDKSTTGIFIWRASKYKF